MAVGEVRKKAIEQQIRDNCEPELKAMQDAAQDLENALKAEIPKGREANRETVQQKYEAYNQARIAFQKKVVEEISGKSNVKFKNLSGAMQAEVLHGCSAFNPVDNMFLNIRRELKLDEMEQKFSKGIEKGEHDAAAHETLGNYMRALGAHAEKVTGIPLPSLETHQKSKLKGPEVFGQRGNPDGYIYRKPTKKQQDARAKRGQTGAELDLPVYGTFKNVAQFYKSVLYESKNSNVKAAMQSREGLLERLKGIEIALNSEGVDKVALTAEIRELEMDIRAFDKDVAKIRFASEGWKYNPLNDNKTPAMIKQHIQLGRQFNQLMREHNPDYRSNLGTTVDIKRGLHEYKNNTIVTEDAKCGDNYNLIKDGKKIEDDELGPEHEATLTDIEACFKETYTQLNQHFIDNPEYYQDHLPPGTELVFDTPKNPGDKPTIRLVDATGKTVPMPDELRQAYEKHYEDHVQLIADKVFSDPTKNRRYTADFHTKIRPNPVHKQQAHDSSAPDAQSGAKKLNIPNTGNPIKDLENVLIQTTPPESIRGTRNPKYSDHLAVQVRVGDLLGMNSETAKANLTADELTMQLSYVRRSVPQAQREEFDELAKRVRADIARAKLAKISTDNPWQDLKEALEVLPDSSEKQRAIDYCDGVMNGTEDPGADEIEEMVMSAGKLVRQQPERLGVLKSALENYDPKKVVNVEDEGMPPGPNTGPDIQLMATSYQETPPLTLEACLDGIEARMENEGITDVDIKQMIQSMRNDLDKVNITELLTLNNKLVEADMARDSDLDSLIDYREKQLDESVYDHVGPFDGPDIEILPASKENEELADLKDLLSNPRLDFLSEEASIYEKEYMDEIQAEIDRLLTNNLATESEIKSAFEFEVVDVEDFKIEKPVLPETPGNQGSQTQGGPSVDAKAEAKAQLLEQAKGGFDAIKAEHVALMKDVQAKLDKPPATMDRARIISEYQEKAKALDSKLCKSHQTFSANPDYSYDINKAFNAARKEVKSDFEKFLENNPPRQMRSASNTTLSADQLAIQKRHSTALPITPGGTPRESAAQNADLDLSDGQEPGQSKGIT